MVKPKSFSEIIEDMTEKFGGKDATFEDFGNGSVVNTFLEANKDVITRDKLLDLLGKLKIKSAKILICEQVIEGAARHISANYGMPDRVIMSKKDFEQYKKAFKK